MDGDSHAAGCGLTRRAIVAGVAVGALAVGRAAEAQEVRIPVTAQQRCATCEFWAGQRSISPDGQFVIATGRGTCMNPQSPAFQRQVAPDQGVRVWVRWRALG